MLQSKVSYRRKKELLPQKQQRAKAKKRLNKRKNTTRKQTSKITIASPEKRQKISDDSNANSSEKPVPKAKVANKSRSRKNSLKVSKPKSCNTLRGRKAQSKKKEAKTLASLDSNITPNGSHNIKVNDKLRKRAQKNPYFGIYDTLPKEILAKVDWKKENLEGMFRTLTPPYEDKPGLVLKWLKRVSENEIRNIHKEMLNIRMSDRALRRKLFQTFENCEPLSFSNQSHGSDTSSRNEKERNLETPVKKKSSQKIINFNGMSGENNSA